MAMPDAYRGAHLSMNEYIPKGVVNDFGKRTELLADQVNTSQYYKDTYGNFAQFIS